MQSFWFYFLILLSSAACSQSADTSWPEITRETKPGVRWWWPGSAVDSIGLTANMEDLHDAGIGSVEITPIHGVNGYENLHIDFLSPRWMNMYKHTCSEGERLDINIDMSTGTGWPFGGPMVSSRDAASKVFFQKYQVKGGRYFEKKIETDASGQAGICTVVAVVAYSNDKKIDLLDNVRENRVLSWDVPPGEWTVWAVINGKTRQMVKRAAPAGEGWVINHYSREALTRYLHRFEEAFVSSRAPWPNSFFCDSYEVYGANWSENLFDEFERRRGYRLQDYIPELNREGDPATCTRVVYDYRQTLTEILLNEFTIPWTELAHDNASVYAGIGRYAIDFEIRETADNWRLDLGHLCESARVHVNGQDAGIVWSLPYTLEIGQFIKLGTNTLEIDVTNLPANRIRDFDKRGVNWRIFKDINFRSAFNKNTRFDVWDLFPSGLTSPVTITPLTTIKKQ